MFAHSAEKIAKTLLNNTKGSENEHALESGSYQSLKAAYEQYINSNRDEISGNILVDVIQHLRWAW